MAPKNTNKDKVKRCGSKLCCRATAALNAEVIEDLKAEDKSLKGILNDEEQDSRSE